MKPNVTHQDIFLFEHFQKIGGGGLLVSVPEAIWNLLQSKIFL